MRLQSMHRIKGFSLIELVMVMIIISILIAMSAIPLMQGLDAYTQSRAYSALDVSANSVLERMSRIMRSVPSSTNITTATSTQFTFTDQNGVAYSYSLNSGNIVENMNALANNASALTLTYYDKSGIATTTINAIRFIKIALTLSLDGYSYSYVTAVTLPNLH